jgi:hypothetical protein
MDKLSYLGPVGVLASRYQNDKKEGYNAPPKQDIMGSLLSIVMGIAAVYLSWNCNTIKGEAVPMKIFYAFFAFAFAPLYLILYALMIRPCSAV